MAADFDPALDAVAHRPYPLPRGPWLMTQSWHDLLFAHWRVDPTELRRVVPPAFDLDLFAGEAWLAVVPFRMSNVGVRGLPAVPWLSAFPELNVRTYVRVGDKPGVFFFSLDAARLAAVAAARAGLNLPYFKADMRVRRHGDVVWYASARRARPAEFRGMYAPAGAPFIAEPGTLEYFLTERYCLYHVDHRGRPYRLDIHHRPWTLRTAIASIAVNTVADGNGVTVAGAPALLHVAERQDVVAWAPVHLR